MALEAKIDLEKLNKALVMKDAQSSAERLGHAIIRATETACQMFGNSLELELDITNYVLECVKHAKDTETAPWTDESPAAKRRGRNAKAAKGA